MPSYVTPKKNTEYVFYISLVSQADIKLLQTNPTFVAGDVKVSTDGGAEGNISTLPVVTPAGSKRVKVTLSTAEMNGDNIQVTFSDAAGAEWCDITINIQTTVTQIDNLVRATTPANTLDVDASGDVTAGTVGDKTGYSLSQSFPSNFADLSITAGTGLVNITQAAADKVWSTATRTLSSFGTLIADIWSSATRLLTAGTNIVLAKGTGITGFNDVSVGEIDTELTSNHGAGSWGAGGSVVLPVMQGEVYSAVAVQDKEVKIVKGDTPRITFDFESDYTGWTVWFAAKEKLSDTTYAISLREVTWSDASLGQGYIDLSATDTDLLGKYFAELELRQGAQRLTAMKYKLVIIDDVIDA